jgi:chemotaxis protein CheX
MRIIEGQIIKVTENIWKSMMGLEVKVVNEAWGADKEQIASFIQIMGAWEGTVILECKKELSRRLTALILSIPVEKISDKEILDALGELVNIIAGNLREFFPQPCHISLPTAVGGWDYTLRFPSSEKVSEVIFECGAGQFFGVTLLKQGESVPFTKIVKQT